MRGQNLKILTNHPGQKESPTWKAATTYLPPTGDDLWSSIKLAIKLYASRCNFDCVVLGAGASDLLYVLLQSMWPCKTVPCVMIDCLWNISTKKSHFYLQRIILRIGSKSVDRFVVWASREIKAFSDTFGIPREKFIFIPYHTTLDKVTVDPCDGDYIFSGGNFGRDYDTLISAVRGLSVKVLIASTRLELFSHMSIPENVEVRGFTHEEYVQKMAGCLINVVCLNTDLLHSGGQQTFLNSMWLGKPTIVNDLEGACDYIKHGEDGLLVRPKDPIALRNAIELLLNHPELMKEIGIRAAQRARNCSTEEHFKKIISVVDEVVESRMLH